MAKERSPRTWRHVRRGSPVVPKPQAAPAAVDDTPSDEEAAAIAISTVFEPDEPEADESPKTSRDRGGWPSAETPEGPAEVVEETIVDVATGPTPEAGLRRARADGGDHRRDGQGPARCNRRRDDGLQDGALIESDGDTARATEILREKGLAKRGQARRPQRRSGPRGRLHPLQRHGRRARGGQLRDRLRRQYRRVPPAREGPCAAHREPIRARWRQPRRRADLRCSSPSSKISEAQAKEAGKPENIDAQDRRGQDRGVPTKTTCWWTSRSSRTTAKTIQQYLDEVSAKIG